MTILIGALEFSGPHKDVDCLSDTSGIYAILFEQSGEFELVDMGEAEFVREHLEHHPRREQLMEEGIDVSFAVHYTTDLTVEERLEIKDALEREFGDPVAV